MSGESLAQREGSSAHLVDLVRQIPLFIAGTIAFAISAAILLSYGIPLANPIDTLASCGGYLASLVTIIAVDAAIILYRHRPDKPTAFLLKRYLGPERATRFVARIPIFAIMIVIMPVFGAMKSLVPALQPFQWDAALIATDRAIFGTDAWRVLQPMVGYPIITSALSGIYHLWVMLIYPGTLFVLLHSSCDKIRERYFLCFILIWSILGVGLAALLSSVGPCFLQPIMGNAHFAPLMAYLHHANEQYPVLVLPVQDLLLEWYRSGQFGLGRGITAMPSMHVAMAFLYYLAIREVSRKAGWFFLSFCGLIWVGSIHLAYHYWVDGAVSLVATYVLWGATVRIQAWWDRKVATLRLPRAATKSASA